MRGGQKLKFYFVSRNGLGCLNFFYSVFWILAYIVRHVFLYIGTKGLWIMFWSKNYVRFGLLAFSLKKWYDEIFLIL